MYDQESLISNLMELVNKGEWEHAAVVLDTYEQIYDMTEVTAILGATIHEQVHQKEQALDYIETGLGMNPFNYELYMLLGNYYAEDRPDLAFLCYENAVYHCRKQEGEDSEDYSCLVVMMEKYRQVHLINVPPCSIVILSYNTLEYTKLCIESIREQCASSAYELIVIDNASTDGSKEWLLAQPDIKLICNSENVGFPAGCNQGIAASAPGHDIFLLNSDTIVMPNSLFTLRMGLYHSDRIGAAGSITNCASNYQTIDECFEDVKEYYSYAIQNNIPSRYCLEYRNMLIGFALLIKRTVLNEVGLLDTVFSPGNYEDNDIGYRIILSGYRNVLCHNSYIHHWGNKSFDKEKNIKYNSLLLTNQKKYIEKWGADSLRYTEVRKELVGLVQGKTDDALELLEVGCGAGETMGCFQYYYPNAHIHGIEPEEHAARLGARFYDIIQGDIEAMTLPYAEETLDYIVLSNGLEHFIQPEQTLMKLGNYLKPEGYMLARVPNIMNAKIIYDLLHGSFRYQREGVSGRPYISGYTASDLQALFKSAGYIVEDIYVKVERLYSTESYNDFFDKLLSIEGVAARHFLDARYYMVKARKEL